MPLIKKATLLVAFFSIFTSTILIGRADGTAIPFRALWVVRGSLTSENEIDRVLAFAKKNHFNHLFLQVRGRGDAFYNSQVVPKASLIQDIELDPLDYAVKKGHLLGLYVHAWLNVYLLWSADIEPDSDNHLLNRHPEWVDKSSLQNGDSKENGLFLSPLVEGVTNYLLTILEEILTNYDVDGIHLDYVRYKDAEFGYNTIGRIKFESEYGTDPLFLFSSGSQSNVPLDGGNLDDLQEEWNQYRRDSITDFLKKTGKLILTSDPSCILSVAVKPDLEQAKKRYFQEWDRWLVEGLVDYVVPMNYEPSLREFAHNIDIIHDNIPMRYLSGIIMGTAVYNQNALDARDKIKYARITGFTGISLFSYDSHKNDPDFFLPIVNELMR